MSKSQTLVSLFATANLRKDGTRRIKAKRTRLNDGIADNLNDATTPAELVAVCVKLSKGDITKAEVEDRARTAPNFGQLRMVLGNRIRGTLRRLQAAKDAPKVSVTKKATKKVAKASAPAKKKGKKSKPANREAAIKQARAEIQARIDAAE